MPWAQTSPQAQASHKQPTGSSKSKTAAAEKEEVAVGPLDAEDKWLFDLSEQELLKLADKADGMSASK